MYKVEIISNQSVQDDIVELLEQEIPNIEYTIIPVVYGKGIKTKKLGDTVWPEQNFMLFSYVEELETAKKIKTIVSAVREKFPREGISSFYSKAED